VEGVIFFPALGFKFIALRAASGACNGDGVALWFLCRSGGQGNLRSVTRAQRPVAFAAGRDGLVPAFPLSPLEAPRR